MRFRHSLIVMATATLAGAWLAAPASATVTFCNQFGHTIFVAIAYPQSADDWLSRGWLELSDGDCAPFDTALSLRTFYYRGESERYRINGRNGTMTWGDEGDRKFALWEKDNFQYYGAQARVLKSTLMGFNRGMDIPDDDYDVTVTFRADSTVNELGQSRSAHVAPNAGN